MAHANRLNQNVLCLSLALTIQPVLRVMFKMKVVLLILILTNLSSTHFKMPGIVPNWDNTLVGLDSFAFGHYHIDTEMKKVYIYYIIVLLVNLIRNTEAIFQAVKSPPKKKQEKSVNGQKSSHTLRIV